MRIDRRFSTPARPVVEQVTWKRARARIGDAGSGEVVFEADVEVPATWGDHATNVLAQKYLRKAGVPDRTRHRDETDGLPAWLRPSVPAEGHTLGHETSARQIFHRLAGCWTYWGWDEGLFDEETDARAFYDETFLMLALQLAAPNSPQWFNTGLHWAYGITGSAAGLWAVDDVGEPYLTQNAYEHPQPHACFIQPVADDLVNAGGIMDLVTREARLFKFGSGTGTNPSTIRGIDEPLRSGGKASGLISFLRVSDRAAGVIKSGGTCLAPNQRVYTERGPIAVCELASRPDGFICLSYDPPAGRFKTKRARAWLAGEKNLVRIVTDKGSFEVSDDHPVMMLGGIVTRAGDLTPGRSIMPCAVRGSAKPIVSLRDGRGGREFLHVMIAQDVLNWDLSGGRIVHHDDEDGWNNDPSNLVLLADQAEHAALHGRRAFERGAHPFQTIEVDRSGTRNGMHRDGSFWKDERKVETYRGLQRGGIARRSRSMQLVAARSKTLNTIFRVRNLGGSVDTLETYVRDRRRLIGPVGERYVRDIIGRQFGSWNGVLAAMNEDNHRVVAIERLGRSPVYDVEVDCPTADDKTVASGHNFVIWPNGERTGRGIVVFNTRRAAKMWCVDLDHPEIEAFVDWKTNEEAKAAAIAVGSRAMRDALKELAELSRRWNERDADPEKRAELTSMMERLADDARAGGVPEAMIDRARNGMVPDAIELGWMSEAEDTVSGQNANNSVRPTNEFFDRVDDNGAWDLTARTTGKVVRTLQARDLWSSVCRAAWACADPGVQFDTTINEWHTCPNDGRINASNPCSEYMFLDDTACFTGETLVWTSDGPRRFDELAKIGRTVPVLTELENGRLAYRDMIAPRLTGRAADLVEVTFKARGARGRRNSYTTLRCTPDHEFFLRDGSRTRAIDLKPGVSVESAYRSAPGYAAIYTTSGDHVREHLLSAEYVSGRRSDPTVEHGHHEDYDRENNAIGNVELVDKKKHIGDHARRWFQTATPEALRARADKISKANSGRIPSEVTRQRMKTAHLGIKQPASVVEKRATANRGKKRDGTALANLRTGARRRFEKNPVGATAGTIWITDGSANRRVSTDAIPDGWHRGQTRAAPNHTIVSVKRLEERADVYCGTVQATGRFFVSLGTDHREGVLVKNCNLASLRLTGFLDVDRATDPTVPMGRLLDLDGYEHAVRLWTIVLEVSVYMAAFPSREIARRSYLYRTLGLGYADLGALLMRLGLPYDSPEGRSLAAGLTALMTGVAYRTSAELAETVGPFDRWEANEEPMRRVLRNHARAASIAMDDYEGLSVRPYEVDRAPAALWVRVHDAWVSVLAARSFRNAQVTLLAPTGTISFVMGCDTTGVEPDLGLAKQKNLAGGGTMFIVNRSVGSALRRLGYPANVVAAGVKNVETVGSLDRFAWRDPMHEAVFDCANPAPGSGRFIRPLAHVEMVAAVQPFLSGAVSKTVNLPNDATIADFDEVFRTAHRLGVKAIAPFRDGCKLSQPLTVAGRDDKAAALRLATSNVYGRIAVEDEAVTVARGRREYLPWRREHGFGQKVKIGNQSVHVRVHEYPDGRPAEVFMTLSHAGSDVRAWADVAMMGWSFALQYGMPVEEAVDNLVLTKFMPAGPVEGHDRIKMASSVADYLGRELGIVYCGRDDLGHVVPLRSVPATAIVAMAAGTEPSVEPGTVLDRRAQGIALGYTGDICPNCDNATMRPIGTCLVCETCYTDTGCG